MFFLFCHFLSQPFLDFPLCVPGGLGCASVWLELNLQRLQTEGFGELMQSQPRNIFRLAGDMRRAW